ncbi:MAG: ParB/RepB/Spo0J family partition protein [Holosporales bacterium]|jgi:ParB family chromosome partitioning protein|nr:ParB/RepB/Spo0J family partition protein [Holosporales bacterium]
MNGALGKGLSSLLGPEVKENTQSQSLPVQALAPNPFQPRRKFNEESIEELAQSIREHGIIQPILVRPDPADPVKYQIVAGERRWRAAMKAHLAHVPCFICALNDQQSLEYALLENVQREDLNCIEEGEAYARLIREFHHTQEQLSRIIGKSRSHIANLLRLLTLPDSVKDRVRSGELSFGHARALIGRPNVETIAQDIIARGMTVRQTEKKDFSNQHNDSGFDNEALSEISNLEEQLTRALRTRVRVDLRQEGGAIHVYFRSLEELQRLIEKFAQ